MPTSNGFGHSLGGGGGSDDEITRNHRSPWIKTKSPRPSSPTLPSHMSRQLPGLGIRGEDELDMPMPRRGLTHLSPLDPLDNCK